VSMVSNGAVSPNSTMGEILRQSRVAGLCPAQAPTAQAL